MKYGLVFVVVTTFTAIYFRNLMRKPVATLAESSKCSFCYGTSLCSDIDNRKIQLQYTSFSDFFYNLLSVKNVFFAEYEGFRVVLKKLGHQAELDQLQKSLPSSISENLIIKTMVSGSKFKTCTVKTAKTFLKRITESYSLEEIWTILQINAEPLILTLLKQTKWVPKIYGACGFVVVEEYCGLPFNDFSKSEWRTRVFLALQLIEAAVTFTSSNLRLYLTDISPDNIAVDDDFILRFVDLENVILNEKLSDNDTVHYSENFGDEEFAYSEEELCGDSVSDLNIYAVCKLLLSSKAPWPMVEGGLLHSPPTKHSGENSQLSSLLEKCVYSEEKLNRFYIAKQLTDFLLNLYIT